MRGFFDRLMTDQSANREPSRQENASHTRAATNAMPLANRSPKTASPHCDTMYVLPKSGVMMYACNPVSVSHLWATRAPISTCIGE